MENRVLKVKKGTEIEIVQNVIYMQGFPLPMEYQHMVMQIINSNEKSFEDVTRSW